MSLFVKVGTPAGTSRGVMFLLAGGPGQASTEYFDLGQHGYWQNLFAGYTLVTVDPRGTGESDPVRCHSRFTTVAAVAGAVAACAHELGPARDFYRTTDNASDLDAVRRELGFRKIGLFGVSYGTDVALTYARLFPGGVSRLLLDSVAAPLTSIPLMAKLVGAVPATLSRFCRTGCSGITADYARDVISLANSLEAKPVHGRVLEPGGGHTTVRLDGSDLLGLVVGSDLDRGLRVELPAAVQAALHGEPLPLLRLDEILDPPAVRQEHVEAVYTATNCDDGPFPWVPSAPISERRSDLDQRSDWCRRARSADSAPGRPGCPAPAVASVGLPLRPNPRPRSIPTPTSPCWR